MLDTINGLPAHPLYAHLAGAMVFGTALLAILVVLWPAVRRRIGGAVLFLAVGTLMAIPLTTHAGAWLEQRVMCSEILSVHAGLASQLILWSALLTISLIAWWAMFTPLFADHVAVLPHALRRIGIVISGLATLVFAVVSAWLVVRIGDTGTRAVWAP